MLFGLMPLSTMWAMRQVTVLRFSRSRSGQDQDRPLKGLNGPALGRVQAFHGK